MTKLTNNIPQYGDTVYYGVVHGVLLGAYGYHGNEQALFMSDEPRSNFKTFTQLYKDVGKPYNNVCQFFVNGHFKSDQLPIVTKRFLVVPLYLLKKDTTDYKPYKDLERKRHLHITMAKHYIKSKRDDADIERVCLRIEEVQSEMEKIENAARQYLIEDKANITTKAITKKQWHLSGTASYE